MGRALGGWAFSGNYIIASGQRYTPSQIFAANGSNSANIFDNSFLGAFNSGVDLARPFLGNMSAPADAVGIFASDACALFVTGSFSSPGGGGMCDSTVLAPTTLISLTALNKALPRSRTSILRPSFPHQSPKTRCALSPTQRLQRRSSVHLLATCRVTCRRMPSPIPQTSQYSSGLSSVSTPHSNSA